MEIYNILEIANTHGGKADYIKAVLKEFDSFKKNFGIKFQPLKYDEIALKDYHDYEVYKKFFISKQDWKKIIKIAHGTKDVWIDIFDDYSIEILKDNLKLIHGLKFQASSLNNYNLFKHLSFLDLSEKILILNISSFDLNQIEEVMARVQSYLSPKEIVLQIGFQDFPTKFLDSGLSKIKILMERFKNRISFADHIGAKLDDSLYVPVFASILGASIIEKHVRHSNLKTKYDFQSSISFNRYKKYLDIQKKYSEVLEQPFINKRENNYLKKTLQIPILNKSLGAGQLMNIEEDLDFKRSDKRGLDIYEIRKFVENFYILSNNKKSGDTLEKKDFKKSNIATIIACRLKSTRLPKKAILKIGDLSSIELCIKNALKLKNVKYTILATSYLPQDDELEKYTFSKSVIFHRGHPDDVIQRYLDITEKLKIDVVIRARGDMQYLSDDILQVLLKSHFQTGADYTAARNAAIGTDLEIISSSALKKVKSFFPSANYSEYMTYYFTNNPSYFKLNRIDLPKNLTRNYRLTLDYKEDLNMFNLIEMYFKNNNLEYNIGRLFDFLDKNPEVANINKDCIVKFHHDKELIKTLKKETTIKKHENGKN